jgi:hypothetical protein
MTDNTLVVSRLLESPGLVLFQVDRVLQWGVDF